MGILLTFSSLRNTLQINGEGGRKHSLEQKNGSWASNIKIQIFMSFYYY